MRKKVVIFVILSIIIIPITIYISYFLDSVLSSKNIKIIDFGSVISIFISNIYTHTYIKFTSTQI